MDTAVLLQDQDQDEQGELRATAGGGDGEGIADFASLAPGDRCETSAPTLALLSPLQGCTDPRNSSEEIREDPRARGILLPCPLAYPLSAQVT